MLQIPDNNSIIFLIDQNVIKNRILKDRG